MCQTVHDVLLEQRRDRRVVTAVHGEQCVREGYATELRRLLRRVHPAVVEHDLPREGVTVRMEARRLETQRAVPDPNPRAVEQPFP